MPTTAIAINQWCPMSRVSLITKDELPVKGVSSCNRLNAYSIEDSIPDGAYCAGDLCMAWRWSKRPILSITGTMTMDDIKSLTGREVPNILLHPASPEAYYDEVFAYLNAALLDPVVLSYFSSNEGFIKWGFRPGEKACIGDDDNWDRLVCEMVRDEDASAIGYCGLAGREGS